MGWGESQEEVPWPSLAPAGILKKKRHQKTWMDFFLLRHMSYGCPRWSRSRGFCGYTGSPLLQQLCREGPPGCLCGGKQFLFLTWHSGHGLAWKAA